jgi:hypothetical protein
VQVAFEHQAEARWKQNVAVLGAFAPIDENFAGIEVDIADLDVLFLQVQSAIKSGTLNLEHSYKYRPLDAYLIDRERWQGDKPLLIERADLQAFLDPQQVLAELDAALYRQYLSTNAHILDGENPHERDLLWHSLVFSAADRESAYVIDGLMHNEVVKSDIHSTDAFGYTEAIFATT